MRAAILFVTASVAAGVAHGDPFTSSDALAPKAGTGAFGPNNATGAPNIQDALDVPSLRVEIVPDTRTVGVGNTIGLTAITAPR